MAGVVYGYLNTHYIDGYDTFKFFENSVKETNLLFNNPIQYFKDFFVSNYGSYDNFLGRSNSFWNDLRGTLLEKLLSIFNIFSFKNYYIDSLFFNFLTFFGCIALYRIFIKVYPKNSWLIIIGLFIPSTLYFTSGIHKDGLIFLGMAMSIFTLYQIIELKNKKIINYVFLAISLSLILLIRNFFFLALLPALICWVISTSNPKKSLLIFIAGYSTAIALFFLSPFIHPSLNFVEKVCDRQYSFLNMKWARSFIATDSLQPNVISFVKKLPEAINYSLLRPYPSENYTLYYILSGIEVLFLLGIFLLYIFFPKPFYYFNPFILFCLFVSITYFLVIGYTIPIIGAIVRYRSTVLPFLIIPILCNIKWWEFNFIKKNNNI